MQAETVKTHQNISSRERILNAAVILFARQGFDRTGLRELACAAGVNLAMINYFFSSKKNLLMEILDIFFSEYLVIARRELAGDGDLQMRLEKFIRHSICFFAENRNYLLIALTDLHHDDPEIIEHKALWGKHMVEIMEHEVCCSSSVNMAPKFIAPLLTSMMASKFLFSPIIEKLTTRGAEIPDIDTYSRNIVDVFLRGIADNTEQKSL